MHFLPVLRNPSQLVMSGLVGTVLSNPAFFLPEDLADTFESIVSASWLRGISINIENQNLSKLRDTLLPKLLSGELRVESVKFEEEDKG